MDTPRPSSRIADPAPTQTQAHNPRADHHQPNSSNRVPVGEQQADQNPKASGVINDAEPKNTSVDQTQIQPPLPNGFISAASSATKPITSDGSKGSHRLKNVSTLSNQPSILTIENPIANSHQTVLTKAENMPQDDKTRSSVTTLADVLSVDGNGKEEGHSPKKADGPSDEAGIAATIVGVLPPPLTLPLVANSAAPPLSASHTGEKSDGLKLNGSTQPIRSKIQDQPQNQLIGIGEPSEDESALFDARSSHKNLADKASKVISQSAAGAEKSEKVAVSPQEAPVLATPEFGKVGAGLELGIVPSSNADMQIGKGFLQNTEHLQLSDIGNSDPTRSAARGPIPYGMLPIEIGLGALHGKRSIDVLLSPEELGAVEIRLEVSNNSEVKAHIRADRPETLSLLMNDSHALKSALDQTGMTTTTDSLQFSLRQDGQSQSNSNNPSQQHTNKPQRAYEKSETPNSSTAIEGIPMKPLTRIAGLLDVQI